MLARNVILLTCNIIKSHVDIIISTLMYSIIKSKMVNTAKGHNSNHTMLKVLHHFELGATHECHMWIWKYIASTPTTTLYILRIIEVLFSHSHQCDFLQFHRPKITPFLGDFWTLFVRCSEGFYYTDKLISPKNFRDYSCPFQ